MARPFMGMGRDEYEGAIVKTGSGDVAGILGDYTDGDYSGRKRLEHLQEVAERAAANGLTVGGAFVGSPEEVRTTSSTGGQKGSKPARFDLIPAGALDALARHYGKGAEKYDDNQWRKGYEWGKSYAALQRHLNAWWGGEDTDEETGSSHVAAAAWHCFTLLTFIDEFPEFDDRFKKDGGE